MDKYLKMSSHFVGNVSINTDGQICDDKYFRGSTDIAEDYYAPICHAINSHDELLELLQAHCKAQDDRAKLVRELDVLLNGEDGAAIQASLCDIVAQVKKHGLSFNRVDELVAAVGRLRNHVKNLKHLAAHFSECGGWDVDAYQEYVDANTE